jgi:hypothetical protein
VIPNDNKDEKLTIDCENLYVPYISTQVEIINWNTIEPPSSFKNLKEFEFLFKEEKKNDLKIFL